MAKETSLKKNAKVSESEKPLPLPRPGTSGTENLLITNRRQASEQYIKAQRAEKAYRAKKHATLARYNYNETKAHFKESFSHFKQGVKGLVSVVKAVPHLIGEKREQRRKQADTKKRQRDLEKKKKLDEALARQSQDAEEDRSDDEL
ncbi:hypothetical protein BKA67DRAFT_653024 [Truncatella angustata]|uniref:Uncharacterized protein n=1 Tax=Truncatella angustata TaxID=152316 RepID=A0A9P8UXH6_9PEZI|nr:uncharacterized protein BKA67DRAFT_653024 [Truncatella angustata]KAH6659811.1 hypothetical protein BKA67DRAFT_653024 [Truncatella angustata]KAH8196596.1 hypothetical protein TruAng_009254 [Truncatella angustata]